MIELFSRKINSISLPDTAILTPLPMEDDISSLSAILLDDCYYDFLKDGSMVIDGINVLDVMLLIPFKAKAWIDLSKRKGNGESIDSKNIKKHKNDIFRLTDLIVPGEKTKAPLPIIQDMYTFIEAMRQEDTDLKKLGIIGRTQKEILDELMGLYI